jgi:hypothetical protein
MLCPWHYRIDRVSYKLRARAYTERMTLTQLLGQMEIEEMEARLKIP